MTTLLAKLEVAQHEGEYILYVFRNLESDKWDNKYILCTRYPRLEHRQLEIGEIGFVSFTLVKAGETYYNRITNKEETYNFTHIRFDKFIRKKEEEDNITI